MAAAPPIDSLDPTGGRKALVEGNSTWHDLTEAVAAPLERKDYTKWWAVFLASLSLLGVLGISVLYLIWEGTGIWGLNNPVGWGWAIVNFVFWVGIGHAGTLISAILYLFRQKWRTAVNRSAEAMTIFAVICALLFPTIHVGRIWVIYWMFPVPNQMDMWPNFRSPLLWDVFAVSTYFTVSLLFWYVGLIPDLATMRDRAKTKMRKLAYGVFALGWRGSTRHWQHYEIAYLLLAAMATPLVLSVHTIVSFDFAVSQLPGWHTTIFPPYFVAGAIFSGFAMVLTLLIPARRIFDLDHIITTKHLENMAKIILLTGSLVGYAYAMEFFIAWYSGNEYEAFAFVNRAFGDYAWAYWIMMSCNVISPQFFWSKRLRRNPYFLFFISIVVNIGMWFERFVITVTSLHHDFLPSSWDYYSPTIWDVGTFIGSFGLFFTLFSLFVRYLPFIALAEVKAIMPYSDPHYAADADLERKGIDPAAHRAAEAAKHVEVAKPAEEPAADEPPAAEEPEVAEAPPASDDADDAPADEAPAEETPASDEKAEDEGEGGKLKLKKKGKGKKGKGKAAKAADEPAAEEPKAEEAPAEEAKAAEAPAEEAAAEAPAEEAAASDSGDADDDGSPLKKKKFKGKKGKGKS